jgi:hypothetical protein
MALGDVNQGGGREVKYVSNPVRRGAVGTGWGSSLDSKRLNNSLTTSWWMVKRGG